MLFVVPPPNTLGSDPLVRYGALGILGIIGTASAAIMVHGYWLNPSYDLPPFLAGIITSLIGGALTILGYHAGSQASQTATATGSAATAAAVKEVVQSNGTSHTS